MSDSYSSSSDESIFPAVKRRNISSLLISSDDSSNSVVENLSDGESESDDDFIISEELEESFSSDDESVDDFYNDDDGLDEEEERNDGWTNQENLRLPFNFSGNPGIKFDVPSSAKEKCLFYLDQFIDDELLSVIVQQTNLFAQQFIESHNPKQRSRTKNWQPTNCPEMKCFIAMLMLQGIIRKPTIEMYFSKRESVATPFFGKVLSHERFLLLCKFLHFENNKGIRQGTRSKLFKIKNLVEIIRFKCKDLYVPEQNICIDECLVLWKGRLSWKQYIPSKRSRFGIKFYVLCESQSGYIWNFCIYTGKDTDYGEHFTEYKTSSRIVLELAHDLLHQGYKMYLDNWYTSIELANQLCARETDVVGTMRQHRIGIPSDIKNSTLTKGQSISTYNNKIMLLKWRDKRDVLLLSTFHSANMIEMEKRGVLIRKPEVAVDYGKKMGGVDRSDGIIASYTTARKRMKKYYKKIFLHLIDIVCLNAFILYKKNHGKLNRLNFLLECIEQIVEENVAQLIQTPKVGRPSSSPKPTRLIGKHFPNFIPATSTKRNPLRRCAICSKKGIRKESRYWCSTCQVPLCIVDCFEKYHTETKI